MNKIDLKELVKKYFSLTEMTEDINTTETSQEFDSATLVDGTKITNKKDSSFAVGDDLFVITEEGDEVLAPSGEHTTESGITVTVDGEGKITGIAQPDGNDEGSLADHEEDEMKEEMSSEASEEIAEVSEENPKTEMAEEDETIMEDHESEMREEIIEAIMTEVAAAITSIKDEMTEVKAKLEDHEEKMKDYMSKPASDPTSETKFSKTPNIKTPKAVYNTKRYEKALFKLNNSK